ncbi:MAG TPA: glycosyltransferase 87 family protein [Candidatus Binatia bacterium]|nr:glycosyltransferase 87 family protein [Candidatus Binatia bacterium]
MTAPGGQGDTGAERIGVARTAAISPPVLARFLLPPILVLFVAAATPTAALFPNQSDVKLYLEKAAAFTAGGVPYRDFPLEYPPGALVSMVVPYLLWPFGPVDLDAYKWLFAAWEAALLLVLGLVLASIVRRGGDAEAGAGVGLEDRLVRTGTRLAILAAGAVLTLTWRYDLFPALLLAAALRAALDGRPGVAGVAMGLGFLAKLFPVAALPALAALWLAPFDLRRLLRLGIGLGATVVVGIAPFLLIAGPDATLQFLRYNTERGLQVESIGGGLALLGGLVTGDRVDTSFGFGSLNIEGNFAETWLALLPVLTVAGFGLVAVVGWRRIRAEAAALGSVRASTVVELATICVLLLVANSKVYSIQYVVWFLPLATLLAGRRFLIAAVLMALTIPIHPLLYDDLVAQQALPILVLNARNALHVALLGWMVWEVARPARLGRTGATAERIRIPIEGRRDWLDASRSA